MAARNNTNRRAQAPAPSYGEPDSFEDAPPRSSNGPRPANPPAATGLIEAPAAGAGELARAGVAAEATARIQACVMMAKRFPRDEDNAYGLMIKACGRPTFQEKCRYVFPRGRKQLPSGEWVDNLVEGPSVHLAREFARVWGNVQYGFHVVFDDGERMQLRGYAWDTQTLAYSEQDAAFRKLIFRKGKRGEPGKWIVPDEREMRELVNKHGAIAERNCLLKLLPPDMVEDVLRKAAANQEAGITNELDKQKKEIVSAFAEWGVPAADLVHVIGHPWNEVNARDVVQLRGIYASIRDGNSYWSEYMRRADERDNGPEPAAGKSAPPGKAQVTMDELTGPPAPPAPRAEAVEDAEFVERRQVPPAKPLPARRTVVDEYRDKLEAYGDDVEAVQELADQSTTDDRLAGDAYTAVQAAIAARLRKLGA